MQEYGLVIANSPQSVENRPVDDAAALSLQEIYAKVFPSVASISCVHQNGTSTGTGIVMSADGYVITNFHVIEDAQQIYVLVGEDSQYVAELVGGDETTDIAVLKVDAADLIPAEFGDSDVLRVGDAVVAIGDPLGSELRGTMTDGIVSAINRDLNLSGRQMTLIQTNAALNSGNSGGPLINCYGQVIGINTMKMSNYSSTSSTVEGLGFAIPITAAEPIIDELIEKGYVSGRPAIGIQGQTLDLRAQFFYHMPSGVVITGILEESDAAQKGLEPDDIIVGFDNRPISSLEDLVAAKNDLVSGNTVTLTIFRGGKYYYVDVVLMDQISPEIY
jgi:serine protease Do